MSLNEDMKAVRPFLHFGGYVSEDGLQKKLLIYENYPSLHEAFELMLSDKYDLVFADQSSEPLPPPRHHAFQLAICDIDNNLAGSLQILQAVRQTYPEIPILLVSGEFDFGFQTMAIQRFSPVRFLNKPWKSAAAVVEQIQIILGDKKSSIHERILRVPLALSRK